MTTRGARQWATSVLAVAGVILAAAGTAAPATSPLELPPSLQALPIGALLSVCTVPHEPPSLAAEIARHHAWAPAVEDELEMCPALAEVIRRYPGTADARRSLFDIACIYARKGDWVSAEAPFRYAMEAAKGRPSARVAHLRLVELHRYTGAPAGVDLLAESRSAVTACAGTPEEGFARLLLADLLTMQGEYAQADAEYSGAVERFAEEPYASYARIRHALLLVLLGEYERARRVIDPVLHHDPVWAGRACWVRATAYAEQGMPAQAILDYRKAAETADSVWVRGQSYAGLARLYAAANEHEKALESLQTLMRFSPSPTERLDTQISIIRSLFALGRYVETAQAAVDVEMEVVSSTPGRYLDSDANKAKLTLDPIIAECEAALSRQAWGDTVGGQ